MKIGEHCEIAITSFLADDDEFAELVELSLALVARVDPRRYSRIRTRLRWIVGSHVVDRGGGRYSTLSRCCKLNPSDNLEGDLAVASDAKVMVHEATHGRLVDLGFSYTRETRLRIERICCAEENRFYARLDPEKGGALRFDFDPVNWTDSWSASKWQRLSRDLRRLLARNA